MRKVSFIQKAQERIDEYGAHFRSYYEDLYKDSGIWAEDTIISSYMSEGLLRKDEIYDTIVSALQHDTILGRISENTTILRWRSKYLFVTWEDDENDRIITHLEIR